MRMKYQLKKNQNQQNFKVHQTVKTMMRPDKGLNFDQEKIQPKEKKSKVKNMKNHGTPFSTKKVTDLMKKI